MPLSQNRTTRRHMQLEQRLRTATERYQSAERARVQAIVDAHMAGLSLRQIALAVGLSRSRVHQLLQQNVWVRTYLRKECPDHHYLAADGTPSRPTDTMLLVALQPLHTLDRSWAEEQYVPQLSQAVVADLLPFEINPLPERPHHCLLSPLLISDVLL